MNKEFVKYNEALALKELGFDEPCYEAYTLTGGGESSVPPEKYNHRQDVVAAPLYQQAFRWFREKYDLQCWFHDGGILGKTFIKITGYKHDKFYFSSSEQMEYEEAEQACLEKLIEIVKTNKNE